MAFGHDWTCTPAFLHYDKPMTYIDLPPERYLNDGNTLIEQGEPAFEAYLMISGQADVWYKGVNGTTKVGTLTEGDIFGEAALFKGSDYGATVKAVGEITVQPIPPSVLDEKIRNCDPMLRALIRMMMVRLRKKNHDSAE